MEVGIILLIIGVLGLIATVLSAKGAKKSSTLVMGVGGVCSVAIGASAVCLYLSGTGQPATDSGFTALEVNEIYERVFIGEFRNKLVVMLNTRDNDVLVYNLALDEVVPPVFKRKVGPHGKPVYEIYPPPAKVDELREFIAKQPQTQLVPPTTQHASGPQ